MLNPVHKKTDSQFLPHRIYWEVTRGCNLRCMHCRATPTELASPEDLTTPQCRAIMDQIAAVGHPVLILTGGEPLFRSDIFELGAYSRAKGFRTGLATNGTLVTSEVAGQIVEAGFQKVGISLDGADATTHDSFRQFSGAFDAAISGFRALKATGMPLQINTSIATHNVHQLEEMLNMVLELGADAWHLFLLVPVGCGIQIAESMQVEAAEYERVLNWLYEKSAQVSIDLRAVCAPHYFRIRMQRKLGEKWLEEGSAFSKRSGNGFSDHPPGVEGVLRSLSIRRGCLAGSSMCFISHKGEVFPCGYLPVKAGNLREETFSEIWEHSPVFLNLRDPNRLEGKCGYCQYKILCSGCRARAYGMTGDYLAEEPFCLYQPVQIDPNLTKDFEEFVEEKARALPLFWDDRAKEELEQIPPELRKEVIRKVEAFASDHHLRFITSEVMKKAWKQP